MPTAAEVQTSQGLLELRWNESKSLQLMGVGFEEISRKFEPVNLLIGLTHAIATDFKPDAPSYERSRKFLPRVRRVSFGSPLLLGVEVGQEVFASVGALAFLIYGAKRVSGLNLELRTHREDLRVRFYEAREQAERAQRRFEEFSARKDFRHEVVGQEQGWGRDASTIVPIAGPGSVWEGDQAVLHVEED